MKKKRMTIRLVLLLLAGAIINVAVAWGCASLSSTHSLGISYQDDALIAWFHQYAPKPPEFPWKVDYTAREVGPGYRYSWITAGSPWDETWNANYAMPTRRYIHAWYLEAGFPAYSVVGNVWKAYDISRDRVYGPDEVTRDWVVTNIPKFNRRRFVFPCCPIWPGFAINMIFYAGVLWLLIAAPLALRKRMRIERGLCPACKYPVCTSDVCTECGAPLKRQ